MANNEPTQQMWEAAGKANEQVSTVIELLRERLNRLVTQDAKGYFTVHEFADLITEVGSELQAQATVWQSIYNETME